MHYIEIYIDPMARHFSSSRFKILQIVREALQVLASNGKEYGKRYEAREEKGLWINCDYDQEGRAMARLGKEVQKHRQVLIGGNVPLKPLGHDPPNHRIQKSLSA